MTSKIINHKTEGDLTLYLVQENKKKAQWKPLTDLTYIIKDVIDYQLKIRGSVQNSQNKQQESMEIQEPDVFNLSKKQCSKNKGFKINNINQRKQCYSEVKSEQKSQFSPIKKKLRGPALFQIGKEQFESTSVKRFQPQKKRISKKVSKVSDSIEKVQREVFKAGFAFNQLGVNYYSIYYNDKTSQVLSTNQMMKRYPQLLVQTLEQMI